jgi:hypothetical protein
VTGEREREREREREQREREQREREQRERNPGTAKSRRDTQQRVSEIETQR